jgi:hypothetical protein
LNHETSTKLDFCIGPFLIQMLSITFNQHYFVTSGVGSHFEAVKSVLLKKNSTYLGTQKQMDFFFNNFKEVMTA